MNRAPRVFLSYAWPDEAEVARICDRLLAAGYRPWMDTRDIPGGSDWKAEIHRAVRSADVFLSVISKNSLDRPGILRGEMREALDIRNERLDDGGFLIPVRLEDVPLPSDLAKFQWVDWFRPDGWSRLDKALPRSGSQRRTALIAIGVACAIAAIAIGLWIGIRLYNPERVSAYESFRRSRNDSPRPPSGQPPQIGVTMWRMLPEAGQGPCDQVSVRGGLGKPLNVGDQFRLGIEPSRPGYLYVFSAEVNNAALSDPILLYPLVDGKNRVKPGVVTDLPPESVCRPIELQHAGDAEEVFILLSDKPVPELPGRGDAYRFSRAVFDRVRNGAHVSDAFQPGSVAAGTRISPAEKAAADGERDLGYADPGPDAVFTFPQGTDLPVIARITLRTVK